MSKEVRSCDRCGKQFVEEYKEYLCRDCLDALGLNATYKTNADRIRSMTDEEMAVFLECFGGCHYCSEYEKAMFDNDGILDCDGDCEQHILYWLKQPDKGADGNG